MELAHALEGVDGYEDGADVGVDLVTQVAHARVVQQRGIRQVQQRGVVALVDAVRVGREVRVGLELVAFGGHHGDVTADQPFELGHHEDIGVLRVLRSTPRSQQLRVARRVAASTAPDL